MLGNYNRIIHREFYCICWVYLLDAKPYKAEWLTRHPAKIVSKDAASKYGF